MGTEVTKPDNYGSSYDPRRPLSNEWTRGRLISDLATGEYTQTFLAEKYGVSQPSVANFKKKYATQITQRHERLIDEYQDLWIATKYNRLAALQTLTEELAEGDTTPRNAEVIDRLLRSAAEELGDLQTKLSIDVAEYRITGIDLDKL